MSWSAVNPGALEAPRFERYRTRSVGLYCAVAGPEKGPLVVLLHGFPEFWYGWRGHIESLAAAGYRVVAPDQRGYGRSDKPRRVRDYKIDTLAQDVVDLIDALGYEKASVVGHDWGAAVAWWTALKHPNRVDRMVALNVPHPAVMRKYVLGNPEQLKRSWYMFFFQLPRVPERVFMRDGGATQFNNLVKASAPGAFTRDDESRYLDAWAQPGAMQSMMNWYRAAIRYNAKGLGSELQVRVPALVLWGEKDEVLLASMARESLDYCDDGALRYFPRAGHFVQHDAREEVLAELLSFLPRV